MKTLTDDSPSRPVADLPSTASHRTVAMVVADILADHPVSHVFGVPGGSISPIDAEIRRKGHTKPIVTKHENTAVFAASGYASATGKLGVATVTSGPGVLNAVTAIASALLEGLPVLILVGEVGRQHQGRAALQDGSQHGLNIIAIAKNVSKYASEICTSGSARSTLEHAISIALSPPRGPVVLTIPMDVAGERTPESCFIRCPSGKAERPLDYSAFQELASILKSSRRGLALIGSGARYADNPSSIRRFVETLGWPVATTPKGKGSIPESHPLTLGVFGMGGHDSVGEYLADPIDTLLVLGSTLGDLSTNGGSPFLMPSEHLIHIGHDPTAMGKTYDTHFFVQGEISTVVEPLIQMLGEPPHGHREAFGVHRQSLPPPASLRVSPECAIAQIQNIMPAETTYCIDSGDHFFFSTHYLKIEHPAHFIAMTGLGSMGSSIGAAIGIKIQERQKPVAIICGDGGLSMMAGEIGTASLESLNIYFFVFNNGTLGMVERGFEALYNLDVDFPLGPFDIPKLAESLGADSITVESESDFFNIRYDANASRPTVVDIRIDPTLHLLRNTRFSNLDDTIHRTLESGAGE